MRYLIAVLLFSLSLSAQTQTTTPKKAAAPKAAPKSKALIACEWRAGVAANALDEIAAKNAELESQKTAVEKKYADAVAVLRALDAETAGRVMTDEETKAMNAITPGEVLNLGASIENRASDSREAMIKLAKHDVQVVDQYNALLSDYKDYVNRVSLRLAQMNSSYADQQRISNGLALYNAMPKYSPPQNINVRVSNCTALPALCAGH